MSRANAIAAKLVFRRLGPADSGGLPRCPRRPVRCARCHRAVTVGRTAVRCGPAHECLQRGATRRRPLVVVLGARSVAVRPGGLVDREATVAVSRAEGAVRGRPALPVNDVSCSQVTPPPTRARPRTITRRGAYWLPALLRGCAQARLRFEPVASPRHRLDVSGRAPLVTQPHAQLADVTVDDVAFDLELTAPDRR